MSEPQAELSEGELRDLVAQARSCGIERIADLLKVAADDTQSQVVVALSNMVSRGLFPAPTPSTKRAPEDLYPAVNPPARRAASRIHKIAAMQWGK